MYSIQIVAKPLENMALHFEYELLSNDISRFFLTLSSHKHQGHLCCVAVVGHATIVVVDRLKADLIFQTEYKNHRIHPQCKLRKNDWESGKNLEIEREFFLN